MKRPFQFLAFILIVAAIATTACLLTRHMASSAKKQSSSEDAHAWIHKQLSITPAQEAALEPIESRYTDRRAQFIQAIRAANDELAQGILVDKTTSPRVNAAIEKIRVTQGELQMLTIEHVFEMRAVLTSEQGEKLLKLTSEALKSETGDSH